jgi:hypothetical protein
LNGQNGSMKIGDITGGRTFKDFEVGFKVYISDSTCCGDADDFSEGHRPADGWSLSIGNDLPDTIGLAEEGAGSGIRICFDTWDSVEVRLQLLTYGMAYRVKLVTETKVHGLEDFLFAKTLVALQVHLTNLSSRIQTLVNWYSCGLTVSG